MADMATTTGSASLGRRRSRPVAVAGAVLATSLLWLLALVLGIDLTVDQRDGRPPMVVGLPMVAGFTLILSLLGWGVLAVLEHRAPRRAGLVWTVLAVAVLVLSFVPILGVGATTGAKVMLSLMHLAVAAVLVPVLGRGARATSATRHRP
jgi:hypothetical protein